VLCAGVQPVPPVGDPVRVHQPSQVEVPGVCVLHDEPALGYRLAGAEGVGEREIGLTVVEAAQIKITILGPLLRDTNAVGGAGLIRALLVHGG